MTCVYIGNIVFGLTLIAAALAGWGGGTVNVVIGAVGVTLGVIGVSARSCQ